MIYNITAHSRVFSFPWNSFNCVNSGSLNFSFSAWARSPSITSTNLFKCGLSRFPLVSARYIKNFSTVFSSGISPTNGIIFNVFSMSNSKGMGGLQA